MVLSQDAHEHEVCMAFYVLAASANLGLAHYRFLENLVEEREKELRI